MTKSVKENLKIVRLKEDAITKITNYQSQDSEKMEVISNEQFRCIFKISRTRDEII